MFTMEDNFIISGHEDGSIIFWKMDNVSPFFQFIHKIKLDATAPITCISVSMDHSKLFTS